MMRRNSWRQYTLDTHTIGTPKNDLQNPGHVPCIWENDKNTSRWVGMLNDWRCFTKLHHHLTLLLLLLKHHEGTFFPCNLSVVQKKSHLKKALLHSLRHLHRDLLRQSSPGHFLVLYGPHVTRRWCPPSSPCFWYRLHNGKSSLLLGHKLRSQKSTVWHCMTPTWPNREMPT